MELERKGMDGVVAEISGGRKKVEEKYVEVESQVGQLCGGQKNSLLSLPHYIPNEAPISEACAARSFFFFFFFWSK